MSTTKDATLSQRRRLTASGTDNGFCKKFYVGGIGIDRVTQRDAVRTVMSFVRSDGLKYIVTPNPEILFRAFTDPSLARILNGAALSLADGIGVVVASYLLGNSLTTGKVCGVEVGEGVLAAAAKLKIPVYFYGGRPGIAKKAAQRSAARYNGLSVAGYHDGFSGNADSICAEIAGSGAKILFVCLGSPRQEIWTHLCRDKLGGVRAVLCLGGSLDIYSGAKKRAPYVFRACGTEWLWRMLSEPARTARLPLLLGFAISILKIKCTSVAKTLEFVENAVYNN